MIAWANHANAAEEDEDSPRRAAEKKAVSYRLSAIFGWLGLRHSHPETGCRPERRRTRFFANSQKPTHNSSTSPCSSGRMSVVVRSKLSEMWMSLIFARSLSGNAFSASTDVWGGPELHSCTITSARLSH